jgi:lia operon protein LiaG
MIGKNTLTRIVIVSAAVAVVSLGIAALVGFTSGGFDRRQAARQGRSVDERKTLDLDGVSLLSISAVSEEVRIVEGQSGSAEAWLHGTVGAGNRDTIPRLETARNGTSAEINVERERRFGFGPFWNDLVLEVSVPKGYTGKLSVKTVSAGIELADHAYSGVSLLTTSGDLRVGSLTSGALSAHTTSGTLKIGTAVVHSATLSSVSGDIEAGALSGDTTVHTTSGNVRVSFPAMPARLDASSTSGTITLRFPSDAGFTLDARSTSGDITCKFPITVSESQTAGGRHALHGVVQAGSPSVLARTVSGDIRIER